MSFISNVKKAITKGEKTIHPSWMLDLKDKVLNAPKISTYNNGFEEVQKLNWDKPANECNQLFEELIKDS